MLSGRSRSSRCSRGAACRYGVALAALILFAGVLGGRAGHAAAICSYPILPLADVTRQAQSTVIADVIRERPDASGGFSSTLRVAGVIKGRATGPVITLNGLGHLADDCQGGPRLTRGNRYVLFLSYDGAGANLTWSLTDAEGSMYQLAADGVRFPPEHPLGQPQPVTIAQAEFVRNVGIVAGVDQSRIEALIAQLGLPETIDRAATASSGHTALLGRLPRRETWLAVAAAAILLAGLAFLLWRPAGPRLGQRP